MVYGRKAEERAVGCKEEEESKGGQECRNALTRCRWSSECGVRRARQAERVLRRRGGCSFIAVAASASAAQPLDDGVVVRDDGDGLFQRQVEQLLTRRQRAARADQIGRDQRRDGKMVKITRTMLREAVIRCERGGWRVLKMDKPR